MRLIITFLMAWCLSWGAYAATAPDSKQISQELEQAKAAKPAQPEVVEALQSALNALEERKGSLERIKQYQEVIDNYPKLSATLRAQLNNMRDEPRSVSPGMSTDALNQEILQVSSQLLDKSRQAQQEHAVGNASFAQLLHQVMAASEDNPSDTTSSQPMSFFPLARKNFSMSRTNHA